MKKFRLLCLTFGILLCVYCALPAAAAGEASDDSVTRGPHSVDAAVTLAPDQRLTETAKAAIIYELNSDTMLYSYMPDERIYPSSMVKLMTALVAIENGNLEDMVTVTRTALSYVAIGSVSAGLKAGEELTLEDLLYCLMTASANDAATVIAEHVGGSQDGFIQMMNDKATQLGCRQTHYTNAHGLHDPETYTTARDLCRIMDSALENATFQKLFSAKTYTVPETNKRGPRELKTTNFMMSKASTRKYFDDRVTGGKTGATDEAGRCLTITAEKNGMNLLCIVMGALPTYESDTSLKAFGSFEEAKILLDYAFNHYEYRQVFFDGQTISQYPVQGGMNDVITQPEYTASTVLPMDLDIAKLNWVYEKTVDTLKPPIKKGQSIGKVQVWYGEKCLAQTNLVAMNNVDPWKAPVVPDYHKKTADEGSWKPFLTILAIMVGGAVIFSVAFFAVRIIKISKRKASRRRRRENRRRSR